MTPSFHYTIFSYQIQDHIHIFMIVSKMSFIYDLSKPASNLELYVAFNWYVS